jgi:hypothetical protein
MSLVFPTASIVVTAGMRPGERGLAVGVAVLATVAGALLSGYRLSYLVGAAIAATLALALLRGTAAPAPEPAPGHLPHRPG